MEKETFDSGKNKWENECKDSNNDYIRAVQQEYLKIDESWFRLHCKITFLIVIYSFLFELIMGLFLIRSSIVRIDISTYFIKYLIVPGVLNFSSLLLVKYVVNSKKFIQIKKIYIISLSLVWCCFVLFTAHNVFTTVYFIFCLPVLLTLTYSNKKLTGIVSLSSLLSASFSELFIKWDLNRITVFQSVERMAEFLIFLATFITFSIICISYIRFEQEKNKAVVNKDIERRQLKDNILKDELTCIYNRKAFSEALDRMDKEEGAFNYSLVMLDIDCFKIVNDTWGHHVGDLCLMEFGRILRQCEETVTSFRYGGDEFFLIFKNVKSEYVKAVCEEIKDKVNQISFEDYPDLKLTASFGITNCQEKSDFKKLIDQADHAMYQAKKERNSIFVM